MESYAKSILDTWGRHHRINQYALDHIPEPWLSDKWEQVGGRSISEQFAHIHQVRRMWLQVAAPDLWEGVKEVDRRKMGYKQHLKDQLTQSSLSILELLDRGLKENRIKGFKLGPVNFMGYLIAHESHHRGQLILTLKALGRELPQEIAFGIWDWGKRGH